MTGLLNKTRVKIRQGSFHFLLLRWVIVICSITPLGKQRFLEYVDDLKEYLKPENPE
jgi:hypothetical protein